MGVVKAQVNLPHTLDSGQIFRYWKEADGYRVVHGKHAFFVSVKGNQLYFDGISKEEVRSFFRLDDDYLKILAWISKDKVMDDAIKKYFGLRLLRQEPWECAVSFLCSSATNILRIKRDLNNIAKVFGREKDGFHLFPKVGEIDNLKKIKECGTGFRAKYIYDVNGSVTSTFFKRLKKRDYSDAKEELMELPGVGPKVADCVLLFSLEKLNAFPIDVWIAKVLKENYIEVGSGKNINYKNMLEFAQKYFNPYAGYAQQFLYHWRRNI